MRRGLQGGAAAATGAWRVSQRDREVSVHQEAEKRLSRNPSSQRILGASKEYRLPGTSHLPLMALTL